MKSSFTLAAIAGIFALLFLGDATAPSIVILRPALPDSVSWDPGKLFIVSAAKEAAPQLTVSTPWEKIHAFDLAAGGAKENFPKEFYRFFDNRWSIERWSYSFKVFTGFTKPETLSYAYTEGMTIKTLWQKMELLEFVKQLQASEGSQVVVWAR